MTSIYLGLASPNTPRPGQITNTLLRVFRRVSDTTSNQQIGAIDSHGSPRRQAGRDNLERRPLHVTLLCQSPEAGCTRRPKCPRGKSENAMLSPLTPAPELAPFRAQSGTLDP
jgi:hypothetical protein